MSEAHWEVVYEANGMLHAELVRGMLEAQEIPVVLSQEGAGKVYGLTIGPLGRVQILVPVSMLERAVQILQTIETGGESETEPFDQELTDLDDLIDQEE